MPQKIGFDATSLSGNHNGGKNQVCLNLLRGFAKNGLANRFVVFCFPGMKDVVTGLIPDATIVTVGPRKIWKRTLTEIFVKTFILPGLLQKYQIGAFLFPACNTGLRRFTIPTAVIPNDIQSKSHKERFSWKSRMADGFFYHFDFRLRDRIVAISDFDSREIASVYPAYEKKIVRIYNPILADPFVSAEASKGEKPYISAVNIQFAHKNIITLIKAFEKIRDVVPHDLYLVGQVTAESEHLVTYVREHRLNDRIIFKGFVDNHALAEIIKGSALYVNPSLFEGFGMTCVEAMLAGVPVLASRVTAIPEVTMGLCDYYEPPEDADALAAAIRRILLGEEKKTPAQLEAASKKIYERYNYVKISRQYFDFLIALIKN